MTIEEMETMRNLLKSNEKMINSIYNDKPYIDTNIKIEMAIMFLKLNIDRVKEIVEDDLFIDTIENDNYFINGENICNEKGYYPLNFLNDLIKKIYLLDTCQSHENVIEIDFIKINSGKKVNRVKNNKESDEEDNIVIKLPGLTKGEKRYILEKTLKLTEETRDYIKEVKEDFVGNLNYLIYNLLIENKYVAVNEANIFLYILINLYPLLNYYKEDFRYRELNVPQNEISLAKATYCNDVIRFKEKKIDEYEHKKEILYLRKEYLSRWKYGTQSKIDAIDDEIKRIDKKEFTIGIDLYEVKTSSCNYNEQIFLIIKQALKNKTIDLSINVVNPTITIINIDKNEVENLLEMHLSTLLKIVNNKKILEIINKQHKLKKEI